MFGFLAVLAALLFIAHLILLIASFPPGHFDYSRYFWSHITLWATGLVFLVTTMVYSGTGESELIDSLDTALEWVMIPASTMLLSFAVHGIVRQLAIGRRNADSRRNSEDIWKD